MNEPSPTMARLIAGPDPDPAKLTDSTGALSYLEPEEERAIRRALGRYRRAMPVRTDPAQPRAMCAT